MRGKQRNEIWDVLFFTFIGFVIGGTIVYIIALWTSDLPVWMKFFLMST